MVVSSDRLHLKICIIAGKKKCRPPSESLSLCRNGTVSTNTEYTSVSLWHTAIRFKLLQRLHWLASIEAKICCWVPLDLPRRAHSADETWQLYYFPRHPETSRYTYAGLTPANCLWSFWFCTIHKKQDRASSLNNNAPPSVLGVWGPGQLTSLLDPVLELKDILRQIRLNLNPACG